MIVSAVWWWTVQAEMVRDLSRDLEVCMQSTNTYVQKKVRVLCLRPSVPVLSSSSPLWLPLSLSLALAVVATVAVTVAFVSP